MAKQSLNEDARSPDFLMLVQKLANRRFALSKIKSMNYKDDIGEIILERQKRLVKKAELELQIVLKRIEFEHYQFVTQDLEERREDSHCPACRYLYETPDGRKLSTEEIMSDESPCTLHPGREHEGYCGDFEDYGIVRWDAHFKTEYQKMNLARNLAEGTRREISDLEQQLNSIQLPPLPGE